MKIVCLPAQHRPLHIIACTLLLLLIAAVMCVDGLAGPEAAGVVLKLDLQQLVVAQRMQNVLPVGQGCYYSSWCLCATKAGGALLAAPAGHAHGAALSP
jgi:hypothetical protein